MFRRNSARAVACAFALAAGAIAQSRCSTLGFDVVVSARYSAPGNRWFVADSASTAIAPLDWNGFTEPSADAFAADERFCGLLVALKRDDASEISIERCVIDAAAGAVPTVVSQKLVFSVPGSVGLEPVLLYREAFGSYLLLARDPGAASFPFTLARLSIHSETGFAIPLPAASSVVGEITSISSDLRGNVFLVALIASSSTAVHRMDALGAGLTTVWCSATQGASGAPQSFAFAAAVDHMNDQLIVGGAAAIPTGGNVTCLPATGVACPATGIGTLSTSPGTLVNTVDVYASRSGRTFMAQAAAFSGGTVVGRVASYVGCPSNAGFTNVCTLPASTYPTKLAVFSDTLVWDGVYGAPGPLDGVALAKDVLETNPPLIGSSWLLAGLNFAPGQGVFVAVGNTDVATGLGFPLPFPLNPAGTALLGVDPAATVFQVADVLGRISFTMPVPNVPALIGLPLMAQFLGLTASGGVEVTPAYGNVVR